MYLDRGERQREERIQKTRRNRRRSLALASTLIAYRFESRIAVGHVIGLKIA